MTTKRLAMLLALLLVGLSGVYFLPQQLGYQPVGIKLFLPTTLGPWTGREVEVSEDEHHNLGGDTEFARKNYTNAHGEGVLVSIVLAGQDMMSAIHRPERCLLAQGWNPGGSSQQTVEVPGFGTLPVTRLRNSRKVQLQKGAPYVPIENICYYWFVGAHSVVGTHERRVFVDSLDRVLHGYNQRWAMVLVAGEITGMVNPRGRTEEQTDAEVQEVIRQILPGMLQESVHHG